MQKKNGKMLLVGIVGAVVVLAALLALVLTQCNFEQGQKAEETVATQPVEEGYELYWNVDRKEYDGKSEAGMSSRKMASDGYYHVRFFKDGQMVELKVADRKLINTIDTTDLMGLTFDEEGIVVGVVTADKLPLERVGWLFYVQSTGGNLIKLNSSRRMDGLEVLVEVGENTAIYDMTGLEGEVGCKVKMPSEMDRVIAIANLQGEVTHVFVTDRSEFMFTVEAECQHCKQVVSWKKYTKTDEFPALPGHYILQNDIRFKGTQVALPEECSICVDLNGKTVSRTDGGRTIALFNPGVKFALMDNSAEQTGTILVTGTGDQGLGVWLRYGEFHFYSGTIDARAANSRSGGAAVALDADTYMYMYGGRILGGNANAEYNEETNAYSRGLGGAVFVRGKFVMYDGVIEDGKANPVVGYNAKGQLVNNRGFGGNMYVGGSGVAELKGGVIRNGYAGVSGGNLYVDGTAEVTLEGTQIQGGYVDGRGCNGGSVYVGSKASFTMKSGSITGGYCFNEGGNIYCGGTFQMQGGYIGGGTVYTYGTGKINENNGSFNLFLVNGTLYHYAGTIAGGVHAIDTSATRVCSVVLSGSPVINGGEKCKKNLTLNTNGDGVKLQVYQLSDYARIGVGSVGIFSEKTHKSNADNFFSDVGGNVLHFQERLAVGKLGCVCASEEHYGACDGEIKIWLPHTKTDTLPLTEGYWYLTDNVQLKGQQNIRGKQALALDLNGYTVTTAEGSRAYAIFDPEEPITLTLTDSSEKKTGAIKAVGQGVQAEGQCVWIRTAGQVLNLYDVALDASGAVNNRNGAVLYTNPGTTVNMYAGRIFGGTAQAWYKESAKGVVNGLGGNVYIGGTFNMYGGSITGGKALSAENGKGGYTGGQGGNMATGAKAVINLAGGSITGGVADTSGGNIYNSGTQQFIVTGGQISGGVAGNEERALVGSGGNIAAMGRIVLENIAVTGGKTTGNGGNIYVGTAGEAYLTNTTVSGGTAIRGGNMAVFGLTHTEGGLVISGTAETGGNIFVYGTEAELKLSNGTVENGAASQYGGNIYIGKDGAKVFLEGAVVTGGTAKNGGNVALAQKTTLEMLQGKIIGGKATGCGGNIYAETGLVYQPSGSISNGEAAEGGNIYLNKGARLDFQGGLIDSGKATNNGGNVFVNTGATFAMSSGVVQNGFITRDGAGNIDVRGEFIMEGGTVSGGYRVDANGQVVTTSDSKCNLFAYKAKVVISGGWIEGGVMAHTADTYLEVRQGGNITSRTEKPSLTLNAGALLTLGELTDSGWVVLSNDADTKIALSGSKKNLESAKGLVISSESDGALYLRKHTHCTKCEFFDGEHALDCDGKDEARKLWNGGNITENGVYCVHDDITLSKVAEVTAEDATLLVEGTISAEKRALLVKSGAKLTLVGNGTVEAKGANNENTGVVIVDGQLVIDGVTLQRTAGSTAVINNGGVITVGGQVIMNSGVIQNGEAANGGGNVFVNGGSFTFNGGEIRGGKAGVGGNLFLYAGSFTMANDGDSATEPVITGGWATAKNGGNVNTVAGTTFTLQEGRIENGRNGGGDGPGNIYLLGTLNMTGGTISGGYRVEADGTTVNSGSQSKRNIFIYKGTLNMTGGTIDGGVESYTNQSTVKLSGNAVIKSADTAKPSLSLSGGALLTLGEFADSGWVVLSNDADTKIALSGSKKNLESGKGLVISSESDGALYLRKHTHCTKCEFFDGEHALDCDGKDEARKLWNGGNITENGVYCVHDDITLSEVAEVTAEDATLLVEGTVSGEKRALLVKSGAKLTLVGNGTVEAKGADGENTGVVIVDGQLVIDGVTLQRTAGSTAVINNGGVITVGGQVIMNSGVIQNGEAANGGGNVFVNGGSFTFNGGEIRGGKAGVGGNLFLYSGSFTMANDGDGATEPVITGGWATAKNGGNVNTVAGTTFTLQEGRIENGRNSGGDGPGNIYLLGTLNMTGGTISGGYRVEADGATVNSGSQSKRNIFIYKGTLNMSGGAIDGGVESYTNQSTVKLSGNAVIKSADTAKPSLSLSGGALLAVDGSFQSGATIVVSSAEGTQIAASGSHAYKANITSDKGLLVTVEADGMYLRTHTHCSADCGMIDGQHAAGCSGYDMIGWTIWDGSNITENGNYCVHSTLTLNDTPEVTAADAKLMVAGTVSGQKRAFVVESGAKLTLMGSGIVEAKGVNNENAGVISVAGELIINGVILQRVVDDAITVNNGGVLAVSGLVTMESGTIQGGKAKVGGNIYLNGGQFRQNGGKVTGGTATSQGGNVSVSSGTYTLAGGSVENGCITVDGAGNVDVRSAGTLVVAGGTMKGGYRQGGNNEPKCNVFAVNGTVEVTGGNIEGGVTVYGGSGKLKVGKAAKIVSEGKAAADLLSGAQLMVTEPFEAGASVVLSSKVNTKLAATGDRSWSSYITSDNGFKLTYEESGVYLRAADAHVHCLCGSTDGKHKEGCNGFDVVFNATTAFPTATGTYFVSPETLSTGAAQLGKSDGSGAVNIVLCLGGHKITTPETNTARVALIWKNSSLTITDCGSGSIEPNANTVGNGSIFHPAAGSTLKIYNGTLNAGNLSTTKNGPAIDNAGSTYIYGGTIIGGKTTLSGGAIHSKNASLTIAGSTYIYGGKAKTTGGNIYVEGGSFTLSGGIIENGWVAGDSANVDVRSATLTISGGEIKGGNRYTNDSYTAVNTSGYVKRNLFTRDCMVDMTGGTIDGGVQFFHHRGTADYVKISGDVKIVSSEAGKKDLSTNYVLTIAKPGMGANAQIKITSAPAGAFAVAEAGLTLTEDMAACFTNASGTKATVENNEILFK